MTDVLGMLSLPASASDNPVGDPLRQVLGDFLAAHLNATLQTAWNKLANGTKVVERVEVNAPSDNTFVASKLPCLAIYCDTERKPAEFERETDDILLRRRQIVALWVPPPVPQEHRAKREPFNDAVSAAIMNALRRGRTRTYIYPGDTEALASTRGSWIQGILQLRQPLHYKFTIGEVPLEMSIRGDSTMTPAKYPAVKATIHIVEQMTEGLDADIGPNLAEGTYTVNEGTALSSDTQFQNYPAPE